MKRSRRCGRWSSLAALMPLALALVPSGAVADQRVLLAFDNDGYRVTRVMREASPPSAVAKRAAREWRSSSAPVPIAPNYGEIELVWLDRRERVLATRRAPDPRIAHPAAAVGERTGRVALSRGAWLARGPDEAVTLVLRLPARPVLALPAEEERFDLEAAPSSTRR